MLVTGSHSCWSLSCCHWHRHCHCGKVWSLSGSHPVPSVRSWGWLAVLSKTVIETNGHCSVYTRDSACSLHWQGAEDDLAQCKRCLEASVLASSSISIGAWRTSEPLEAAGLDECDSDVGMSLQLLFIQLDVPLGALAASSHQHQPSILCAKHVCLFFPPLFSQKVTWMLYSPLPRLPFLSNHSKSKPRL